MESHPVPELSYDPVDAPDSDLSEKSEFPSEDNFLPVSRDTVYPLLNPTIASAPVCHLSESFSPRAEIRCFSDGVVSKEEIRNALIQHAKNHKLFSKYTIRNMEITDVSTRSAFHYTLQTFTEARELENAKKPYDGGKLDTAENGNPPDVWDITQKPSETFEYACRKSELPHTASVEFCAICDGIKRSQCSGCQGLHKQSCKLCKGKIKLFTTQKCPGCNGKSPSCSKCNSTGKINCRTCDGEGRLKLYKKLTTTWRNHEDDSIINQTNLPDKLIRNASGHIAFQERSSVVCPVDHFPEKIVNETSNILISKHKRGFPNERIMQQRHQIREIPIIEVQCRWGKKNGEFFVYGLEKKVHFADHKGIVPSGCVIS